MTSNDQIDLPTEELSNEIVNDSNPTPSVQNASSTSISDPSKDGNIGPPTPPSGEGFLWRWFRRTLLLGTTITLTDLILNLFRPAIHSSRALTSSPMLQRVLASFKTELSVDQVEHVVPFSFFRQMLTNTLNSNTYTNNGIQSAIDQVVFSGNDGSVVLFSMGETNFLTKLIPGSAQWLNDALFNSNIQVSRALPPSKGVNWLGVLIDIGLVLSSGFALYILLKQQGYIKSSVTTTRVASSGPKFKDVAGNSALKGELQQIVDLLQTPEEAARMGVRIPHGVLLEGPSGTGKTLLARATAGEAGVPFFYASAASFVEVYVGQGASRIRDLFEAARKQAPCLVFIDEIDALGTDRGRAGGGAGQEHIQTLNQLLTELDGVTSHQNKNKPVVLMAATNRFECLDEALTRPGRFDKIVTVPLPSVEERMELLFIHGKHKKIDYATLDVHGIASAMEGCSGADIEGMLNESTLLAHRLGDNIIDNRHVMPCVARTMQRKKKINKFQNFTQKQQQQQQQQPQQPDLEQLLQNIAQSLMGNNKNNTQNRQSFNDASEEPIDDIDGEEGYTASDVEYFQHLQQSLHNRKPPQPKME